MKTIKQKRLSKLEKEAGELQELEGVDSVKKWISYVSHAPLEAIKIFGYDSKRRKYSCEINGTRGEVDLPIVGYL